MDILQAIVYGIIQGLGEFLPISSTAHITLAPLIFGWEDPGLAFDVALHMGTLAAVVIFLERLDQADQGRTDGHKVKRRKAILVYRAGMHPRRRVWPAI